MATQPRIRRDVPIPYYYQLIGVLQQSIEDGAWLPDTPLPSEHDLCATYGVSRTVVRQALGELSAHGFVYRVKGKGTFVAPRKVGEHFVHRTDGFYHDMTSRGHTVGTRVLDQSVTVPTPYIRQQLRLGDGEATLKIDRLRSVDGVLLLLVQTYLPYALCPSLVDADLSEASLYAVLQERCGLSIASGTRVVEALPAEPAVAHLLGVKTGLPLLKIESVSYLTDGRPIEYYEAWHRGDRSKIEIEIAGSRGNGIRPVASSSTTSRRSTPPDPSLAVAPIGRARA